MNNMNDSFQIKWAGAEDWTPAMNMIWKTFLKFEGDVYSPEGVRNFLDFITDEGLFHSFLQGKYLLMIALDGENIVGAASVRDGNHLSLLFVDERYHMQGIGRRLMEYFCYFLKNEAGMQSMTLKSSPYAVGFYRKLGFSETGPEECYSGIQVTPMRKML